MRKQSFWQHFYAYPIVRIFFIALTVGFTVVALSYFIPPTYRCESQLVLSIEDTQLTNYQISEVAKRKTQVVKAYFGGKDFLRLALTRAGVRFSEVQLEKKWPRRFKIDAPSVGVTMKISTFASSPKEAEQLNQAAISVLQEQVQKILGLKSTAKASLRVIENPSPDSSPVVPQPWLYGLIGFFVVIFGATLYYIY